MVIMNVAKSFNSYFYYLSTKETNQHNISNQFEFNRN
jgi:hypothetical protein